MSALAEVAPLESPHQLSLKHAVDAEVERGIVDPTEILTSIRKRYTDEWYEGMVADVLVEAITNYVRLEMGQIRRPGNTRAKRYKAIAWLEAGAFVPGLGWKQHRELTRTDLTAIVGGYRQGAADLLAKAEMYDRCAAAMKKQRAKVLGDVSGLDEVLNA